MRLTKPDRGWAWMVMVASFGAHVVTGTFLFAVGVIHASLLDRFHDSVGRTAWAGTCFLFLLDSASPISAYIVEKSSCRVAMFIGSILITTGLLTSALVSTLELVILCYGVVAGIGAGIVFSSHIVILGYNFDRKRNFASGIAVSGCGVGTLILAPVLQMSRETYGNAGIFFICAGIALHYCVFGALFFPSTLEFRKKQHRNTNEKSLSFRSLLTKKSGILRNKGVWCLASSMCFASAGIYSLYLHFPKYVIETNTDDMMASYMLSLTGLCNTFARALVGMSANADNINETLLYFGSFCVLGLSAVLLPLYGTTFSGQVMFSIILGLYSGSCYALLNTLCLQFASIAQYPSAIGIIMFLAGLGSLAGPPFAGYLVDLSGSYIHCFVFAGAALLLGSVFGAATVCFKRKDQDKEAEWHDQEIELHPCNNQVVEQNVSQEKHLDALILHKT